MKKLEEAFSTCDKDELVDVISDNYQHNIHSDNAVEEPEREVVEFL